MAAVTGTRDFLGVGWKFPLQVTPGGGIAAARYEHLRRRYGSDLESVATIMREREGLNQLLVPGFPYVAGEVVYAARREMARTVDDVLSRRLRVLPFDAGAAVKAAPEVARLMGGELGWDDARIAEEARVFVARALASTPDLGARHLSAVDERKAS